MDSRVTNWFVTSMMKTLKERVYLCMRCHIDSRQAKTLHLTQFILHSPIIRPVNFVLTSLTLFATAYSFTYVFFSLIMILPCSVKSYNKNKLLDHRAKGHGAIIVWQWHVMRVPSFSHMMNT